jgi:type VI secretion system secreted protein Hcp
MALNAYLKMKGNKSGEIKGSVIQKGRENLIMVIAVEHSVESPRDLASGLPTGKRQHKPFTITKELDKSSPILWQMLALNEGIDSWELMFWSPISAKGVGAGVETQHYTVKLTKASISKIEFGMLNNKNPEFTRYAEFEKVSFVYEKIEWTWKDGGIVGVDDWNAPVV